MSEKEGEIIEGDENFLKHAENYSNLFGPGEHHDIHINQGLRNELELVSEKESIELCKPFPENEVKNTLFQMERK
jgi:hypothetical protein